MAGMADQVTLYSRITAADLNASGLDIHISASPEEDLVHDLVEGKLRAAVRGTLPANRTLLALKQASGVDHLERIALLETAGGRKFLLAPVGVDEGWTVREKVEFIRKGKEIARKFNLPSEVAVLSGGRIGDIGRNRKVDRSLAEGLLVAEVTGATHYEILIEDAIREAGLIIAPDGITGNLIFRTLTFLGAGFGHGAPVVNIDKNICRYLARISRLPQCDNASRFSLQTVITPVRSAF